jgi:hypothetical protein
MSWKKSIKPLFTAALNPLTFHEINFITYLLVAYGSPLTKAFPACGERCLFWEGNWLEAAKKQGEKIKGIKLYREKTGLGLKEAHDHSQELDLGERDESLSDEN